MRRTARASHHTAPACGSGDLNPNPDRPKDSRASSSEEQAPADQTATKIGDGPDSAARAACPGFYSCIRQAVLMAATAEDVERIITEIRHAEFCALMIQSAKHAAASDIDLPSDMPIVPSPS